MINQSEEDLTNEPLTKEKIQIEFHELLDDMACSINPNYSFEICMKYQEKCDFLIDKCFPFTITSNHTGETTEEDVATLDERKPNTTSSVSNQKIVEHLIYCKEKHSLSHYLMNILAHEFNKKLTRLECDQLILNWLNTEFGKEVEK